MQGTVRTFDAQTRSGTVLLDDGVELPYGAEAFEASTSPARHLRIGQRVQLQTTGEGADLRVTVVSIYTLH